MVGKGPRMNDEEKKRLLEEEKKEKDDLTYERHLLEQQLVLYAPSAMVKIKMENKILQKKLQQLVKRYQFVFQNRFGPRAYVEANSYLDMVKKTLPDDM